MNLLLFEEIDFATNSCLLGYYFKIKLDFDFVITTLLYNFLKFTYFVDYYLNTGILIAAGFVSKYFKICYNLSCFD